MAQLYQENIISQFQFQTMYRKSNHQCEIKLVQGKHIKFHILNVQPFFSLQLQWKQDLFLKQQTAKDFKRRMSKIEKVIGSWWKK